MPLDEKAAETPGLGPWQVAAHLLHQTASEQIARRERGYLTGDALSDMQRRTILATMRRAGWVSESGEPRVPDGELSVGIWTSWDVHVCIHQGEQAVCRRPVWSIRPPTPEAVPTPPLPGSPLWWAWPHAEAAWGNETLSVTPGVCTVDDLLARLTAASGLLFPAAAEVRARHVAVAADGVSVRALLWALQVVRGLRTRIVPKEGGDGFSVELWPIVKYASEDDGLRPIARAVYYSPLLSPVSTELLPKLQEVPSETVWIGWRYADLPRLYQELVTDALQRAYHEEPAPALDPAHTFVIWTKAVVVSPTLLGPNGSGAGMEARFPAL
jgi:hypothetical protein